MDRYMCMTASQACLEMDSDKSDELDIWTAGCDTHVSENSLCMCANTIENMWA